MPGAGHVSSMGMVAAGQQAGDALLWQRITSGDHEAFGELFDRYAGAVYTHLFRRLGDWSEAEDLTSAVFLQAWRRRSDVVFERDSALPWLFGVANGLLRNAVRSRQRHAALLARVRDSGGSAPGPAGCRRTMPTPWRTGWTASGSWRSCGQRSAGCRFATGK